MKSVLVIGSDNRSIELRKIITTNTNTHIEYIHTDDLFSIVPESIEYDIVILPIPTKVNGEGMLLGCQFDLNGLFDYQPNATYIYANSNITDHIEYIDGYNLAQNEDYLQNNSKLTADAAYSIAKGVITDKTNVNIMIVGLGRIGRHLADIFEQESISYIVATGTKRNTSSYSYCMKSIAYNQLNEYMDDCQIIFNTAPYNYFDCRILDKYSGNYFELASAPYGFETICDSLPRCVTMCPALPGKYYPREAAMIIYDCIKHIFCEV